MVTIISIYNEDIMTEKATFGAGCFWGVEQTFREIPGVLSVSLDV